MSVLAHDRRHVLHFNVTEELSINWTVLQQPSQGLGRRWGEVREFTSRTRGGSRPAPKKLSRRVHLWTRLECPHRQGEPARPTCAWHSYERPPRGGSTRTRSPATCGRC